MEPVKNPGMKAVVIHRVVEAKAVSTRFGERYVADVEIIGTGKATFWMSPKQGAHLAECAHRLENGFSTKHAELHAVIDESGDKPRFVWCGIHSPRHSDIPFLNERFGVACESPYIGLPDASPREADPALRDTPC